MSAYAWRSSEQERAPLPRVHVHEVARFERRSGGRDEIAVLRREGSPPIVSIRHVHSDGSIGGRIELRFDELETIERAIEVARGQP